MREKTFDEDGQEDQEGVGTSIHESHVTKADHRDIIKCFSLATPHKDALIFIGTCYETPDHSLRSISPTM
jgi:hypothetical protein